MCHKKCSTKIYGQQDVMFWICRCFSVFV